VLFRCRGDGAVTPLGESQAGACWAASAAAVSNDPAAGHVLGEMGLVVYGARSL